MNTALLSIYLAALLASVEGDFPWKIRFDLIEEGKRKYQYRADAEHTLQQAIKQPCNPANRRLLQLTCPSCGETVYHVYLKESRIDIWAYERALKKHSCIITE